MRGVLLPLSRCNSRGATRLLVSLSTIAKTPYKHEKYSKSWIQNDPWVQQKFFLSLSVNTRMVVYGIIESIIHNNTFAKRRGYSSDGHRDFAAFHPCTLLLKPFSGNHGNLANTNHCWQLMMHCHNTIPFYRFLQAYLYQLRAMVINYI